MIKVILGYRFIELTGLKDLQICLLEKAQELELLGTLLLSAEGINIAMTGQAAAVDEFQHFLEKYPAFSGIRYKIQWSQEPLYRRLLVTIKSEIITFKQPQVNPLLRTGKRLTPRQLKVLLDQKNPIRLLDTRNSFEVKYGTFKAAEHLSLKKFSEFPQALTKSKLSKDQPIVTFCTGGIRCEKASALLLEQGFREVYQLEGGILAYFDEVGGTHFEGTCFVFDERMTLSPIELAHKSVEYALEEEKK